LLLTPFMQGQATATTSPLMQGEEHRALPPPTEEQKYEMLLRHDAEIWILKLAAKAEYEGRKQIWQHLIPTGWWRPRLKRPT
jgi:hypothetical protein